VKVSVTAKSLGWLRSLARVGALAGARPALGVLVAGGDGSQNSTPPANFNYWNNIGLMFGTGIYLGDRWVLTAKHVQGGVDSGYTFVVPGLNNGADAVFNAANASQRFLHLPDGSGTVSDLAVFRLQDDPLLNNLPQVQFGAAPAIGTSVTAYGSGYNRDATLRTWRLTNPTNGLPPDPSHPENMVWTDVTGKAVPPNALTKQGYTYGSTGRAKRWGNNVTIAMPNGQTTQEGDSTILFGTRFDSAEGDSQVVPFDSGGPVFVGNRLVGLTLLAGTFQNETNAALGQPANTAVFGNEAYYANLADYVDEVASITHLRPSADGDANLDGLVNAADFKVLYKNLDAGTKWTQGDFNLDGVVNYADFQIFELSFGRANTAAVAAAEGFDVGSIGGTSVPEPAGLGAAAVVALLAMRRRH
jgi:MYXO-CTERM domain-containing protein